MPAALPRLIPRTPRIVLACGGLSRALEELAVPDGVEVRRMDPDLHRSPKRARVAIQDELDRIGDEVAQVTLAWGLCGGAVLGLTARAWLVLPTHHDCTTLLQAGPAGRPGERSPPGPGGRRLPVSHFSTLDVGRTEGVGGCLFPISAPAAGDFHLVAGRLEDGRDPLGIFEDDWVPRVGAEEARRTLQRQLAGYRRLVLNDLGLDDALRDRARRNAELLGLPLVEVRGSTELLRRLLVGEWGDGFVCVPPGQPVSRGSFIPPTAPPAPDG